MNMKRLLSLVAFFATLQASAQQVNPVPDYVFANRMSAGRNTVTDTAAYLSIGPRYGATRGMMPPMVVDTASFSANKRNGLLIFSVQKNKFLYWDSVGVKWAEMAGTGGNAITGSGVAGYMPEFTTTTNLDTTRLYHSAGRFAIGGTTTTNGVFNVYSGQSYFDTSLKVGSQTFLADEGKNEIYINTNTDNGAYSLQISGNTYTSGNIQMTNNASLTNTNAQNIDFGTSGSGNLTIRGGTIPTTHITVQNGGNIGIGTTTVNSKVQISTQSGTTQTLGDWANSIVTIQGASRTGTATVGGSFATTLSLQSNDDVITAGSGASIGFSAKWNSALYASAAQFSSIFGGKESGADASLAGYISFATRPSGGNPTERGRINSAGEWIIDASGTDAGDYKLQVVGNTLLNGNLRTAAPAGGTANDWRLGTVATVTPTSPNRTIEVSIGGTIYYIHAKTTND